jgi:hypothetical protein
MARILTTSLSTTFESLCFHKHLNVNVIILSSYAFIKYPSTGIKPLPLGSRSAAAAAAEGGRRSFPEEAQNGTRTNADLHGSIELIFKDAHGCATIDVIVK